MNLIVKEICEKFINEMLEEFQGEEFDLSQFERKVSEKVNQFVLDAVESYIEGVDQSIKEEKKERKEHGLS